MKKIYFYAILLLSGMANSQITLVKDINNSGTQNSFPTDLFAFDGQIYFAADDSSGSNTGGVDVGKELWVSDGTEAGTRLVKNLDGAGSNSDPNNFFILNNALYFQAYDLGTTSYNIYTTDGTEAGTVSLGNNFQGGTPIVVGNKAYMRSFIWNSDFTVLDGIYYEFNGTTFKELPDSGSGSVDIGFASEYIGFDSNTILFNMEYILAGETPLGPELYSYNITDESYTLVKDFGDDGGVNNDYKLMTYLTKLGNSVYFVFDNKLWVTDGTTNGTIQISTANGVNAVKNLYAWEDKLFFEGDAGASDQLYVYDPAADSLTDLSGPFGIPGNHDPIHFAAPGDGYLYYTGKIGGSAYYLFRTDGVDIEGVDVATIDSVDDIVVLNHKLYFEADFVSTVDNIGRELFTYTNDVLNTLNTSTFELDSSFSIYPNPSTNVLNVQSTLGGEINYTIYNITGKQVLKGTIENDIINHNLTSGLYLLKLDNGSLSTTKKIIVKD
ncbi:T9SS type A sorting domain-containing protein [Flavivirga aquimarina]|uniref:T9SS type A sorting domain-containing protein n=1 Tax=Flavivirga aquimarina TaxID=2027862 RepID=A0ABT8W8K5_9FLAO|nr:T9SS type A sorting domain-containing protein [Flavivirga aquimarina]MDO5969397.1 T9SS type A sorting domain-containing protein [Flavivirga aquimarina]